MNHFFLSYTRKDYGISSRVFADGEAPTPHLKAFHDRIGEFVQAKTGCSMDDAGYRDVNRLKPGNFWGPNLVAALQDSRVLLALISPSYLGSPPCGREFRFFIDRFQLLQSQHGTQDSHRIIAVFWEGINDCWKVVDTKTKEFLSSLQFTSQGFPENYPGVGMRMSMTLGNEA